VFPVRLPPLRDRPVKPSSEARQALRGGHYAGNVRELATTLEPAAILAEGDTLEPRHLLIKPARVAPKPVAAPASEAVPGEGTATLEELERRTIERVLLEVNGNRREAAERLGIACAPSTRRTSCRSCGLPCTPQP
jgi:DNA-binding NtrC family response regulator